MALKENYVGLLLEDKGIMRSGQRVIVEGIGEGLITSGGYSATLGQSIALARVPNATGDKVLVEIRDKQIPAKVGKPRFVKQGKILERWSQLKINNKK